MPPDACCSGWACIGQVVEDRPAPDRILAGRFARSAAAADASRWGWSRPARVSRSSMTLPASPADATSPWSSRVSTITCAASIGSLSLRETCRSAVASLAPETPTRSAPPSCAAGGSDRHAGPRTMSACRGPPAAPPRAPAGARGTDAPGGRHFQLGGERGEVVRSVEMPKDPVGRRAKPEPPRWVSGGHPRIGWLRRCRPPAAPGQSPPPPDAGTGRACNCKPLRREPLQRAVSLSKIEPRLYRNAALEVGTGTQRHECRRLGRGELHIVALHRHRLIPVRGIATV